MHAMPIFRKRVGTVMSVVEEDSASGFLQIRDFVTLKTSSQIHQKVAKVAKCFFVARDAHKCGRFPFQNPATPNGVRVRVRG